MRDQFQIDALLTPSSHGEESWGEKRNVLRGQRLRDASLKNPDFFGEVAMKRFSVIVGRFLLTPPDIWSAQLPRRTGRLAGADVGALSE